MIGVDRGTTRFRAFQIDSSGGTLASRSTSKGILSVTDGDFAAALETVIADWLDQKREPVLMSGSRQGWLETPYVPCPATLLEVATSLSEVRWGKGRLGFICPGLTCQDIDGVPDVTRGEEVQALGALAIQGKQSMTICHPALAASTSMSRKKQSSASRVS